MSGTRHKQGRESPRAAALAAAARHAARPTSIVGYRSAGAVLVIGSGDDAVAAARRLHPALRCTVVVPPGSTVTDARGSGFTIAQEKLIQVSGHLGQYAAVVAAPPPDGGINLLHKLAEQRAGSARRDGRALEPGPVPSQFDLVLDLSDPPLLDREMLPYGYYAPRGDAAALEQALTELPQMIGEFEKPRFFNYDPAICAHGRSGIVGCTRCLDACPTSAIISVQDEVAVDPYLCQGAGVCAAVCPSGAMTYAYPALSDQINRVGVLLRTYHEAGGGYPVLVLHDAEAGRQRVDALEARLPERVLPYELAELGSLGMESWLGMLAHGAAAVLLLPTPETPPRVMDVLRAEIAQTGAILRGMGYPEALVRLAEGDDAAVAEAVDSGAGPTGIPPASYSGFDEKRTMLRLAIEHLLAHAPAPREVVPLADGASFGAVLVNREACTLCMACVGVCPASALSDGGDLPQLQFIEGNCVQCGLCERACPERAIRLEPRFLYDPEVRRTARVLNEEVPFLCVSCGKPFATRKMMERMDSKLGGHWMFQSAESRRRIQMCADCRVRDLFQSQNQLPGGRA